MVGSECAQREKAVFGCHAGKGLRRPCGIGRKPVVPEFEHVARKRNDTSSWSRSPKRDFDRLVESRVDDDLCCEERREARVR